MLSGYNTDVPHADVIFHVQTEDKGRSSAWIESLVYVGGRVLARKGVSYRGRLGQGDDRKAVAEVMDRQHRLTIAEIRKGVYDAKLAELLGGGALPVEAGGAAPAAAREPAPPPSPLATGEEAAEEGEAAAGPAPSLDQVILDYLDSEAEKDHLVLMMDADQEPRLGHSVAFRFHTRSSTGGQAVSGARITVRIISTVAEPVTLATGETDPRGNLELRIALPDLQRGSGALIVTANSPLGSAEIKQLL